MPRSTCRKQVRLSCTHAVFRTHFGWYTDRSVFITTLLILWAYKLTLDPTKPLEDMGFMNGSMPKVLPCTLEFEKRIPETELRSMMQHYPEL